MKRQLYVVLALMLVVNNAWSHGFRGNNGSGSYGTGIIRHSNPSATPLSANLPQFSNNLSSRHLHHNLNAPDSVSNFPRHRQHPYSPYAARIRHSGRSPYTPYSTPAPYGAYVNPYAPDSVNAPYQPNIPYSPGNIANPYGIYSPNPASGSYPINAQQFHNSHRNYFGNSSNNPYNPSFAPPAYGPYSNPFFQ